MRVSDRIKPQDSFLHDRACLFLSERREWLLRSVESEPFAKTAAALEVPIIGEGSILGFADLVIRGVTCSDWRHAEAVFLRDIEAGWRADEAELDGARAVRERVRIYAVEVKIKREMLGTILRQLHYYRHTFGGAQWILATSVPLVADERAAIERSGFPVFQFQLPPV